MSIGLASILVTCDECGNSARVLVCEIERLAHGMDGWLRSEGWKKDGEHSHRCCVCARRRVFGSES